MNASDRNLFAGTAQDAYHYFIAAGGRKLENKYGESAFADSRNDRLTKRLEYLQDGVEKLREMRALCQESLPRGERAYFRIEDEYETVASIEDLDRAARLGIKAVIALTKRFKVDPRRGRLLEDFCQKCKGDGCKSCGYSGNRR